MTSLQIMHPCRFASTDVSAEETATKRNGASVAGSGRCTLARTQVTATGVVGTYPLADGASRYIEHLRVITRTPNSAEQWAKNNAGCANEVDGPHT